MASAAPAVQRLCQEPGATRGRAHPEQAVPQPARVGVRRAQGVYGAAHPATPHTGTWLPSQRQNAGSGCKRSQGKAQSQQPLQARESSPCTAHIGHGWGQSPSAGSRTPKYSSGCSGLPSHSPTSRRALMVGQVPPHQEDPGGRRRAPGEPLLQRCWWVHGLSGTTGFSRSQRLLKSSDLFRKPRGAAKQMLPLPAQLGALAAPASHLHPPEALRNAAGTRALSRFSLESSG